MNIWYDISEKYTNCLLDYCQEIVNPYKILNLNVHVTGIESLKNVFNNPNISLVKLQGESDYNNPPWISCTDGKLNFLILLKHECFWQRQS